MTAHELHSKGLVWLSGAVVCLHAAPQVHLFAIVRCHTAEVVKRFWARTDVSWQVTRPDFGLVHERDITYKVLLTCHYLDRGKTLLGTGCYHDPACQLEVMQCIETWLFRERAAFIQCNLSHGLAFKFQGPISLLILFFLLGDAFKTFQIGSG